MKIALILDNFNSFHMLNDYEYIIGVDKGAINAINNGVALDYAVGDFDSVTKKEKDILLNKVKCKALNPVKDETDTAEALKYAYSLSNDVTIFGGIKGNRIEHFIANLNLLTTYKGLKIIDDNSMIFESDYSFYLSIGEYHYVNFFAIEEVKGLTLKGFKYPLDNYDLKPFDSLTISNEVLDNPAVLFNEGKLLVILTKKD